MGPLTPEILELARADSRKKCIPENSLAIVYPPLLKFWDAENIISPYEIPKGSGEIASWRCPNCGMQWVDSIHYMVGVFGHCKNKECRESYDSYSGYVEDIILAGGDVKLASIDKHEVEVKNFLELLRETLKYLNDTDESRLSMIVDNLTFSSISKPGIVTFTASKDASRCKSPKWIDDTGIYLESTIPSKRAITMLQEIIETCKYQGKIEVIT